MTAEEPGPPAPAPPDAGASLMARRPGLARAARWLSVLAFIGGMGFVVVAFVDSLGRIEGSAVPNLLPMLAAGGLAAFSQFLAGRAWILLLERDLDPVAVARTWYVSQVGKYVPGGVVQAAGQITLTRRLGVGWAPATIRYVVLAGGFIVAGLGIGGAVAVLAEDLSPAVRGLVALGAVTPIAMARPLVALGLRSVRRVWSRFPSQDHLPGQRQILLSWAAQVGFMLAQAVAFALLFRSLDGDGDLALVITSFPLAFAVGTLAVPVPSGLAVREAVLLGVLGPSAGSAVVIAAAVWHRLVTIVADVAMIGGNELHRRIRRRLASRSDQFEERPGEDQPA